MIALTVMGCLNSMAAATTYGVFVAGVQVTSDNADDISRSSTEISGKVYYDASIKTLYLEKASINVRSSYTIKHGIQCKENVSKTQCECVKMVVSEKVSFNEKLRMLLEGASAEELAIYEGIDTSLACAFIDAMANKEDD